MTKIWRALTHRPVWNVVFAESNMLDTFTAMPALLSSSVHRQNYSEPWAIIGGRAANDVAGTSG